MTLQPGELDPSRQTIISIVGSKGSGKSKYARYVAAGYPYDQLHIDLHGIDRPAEVDDPRSGVVDLHGEVPARWPEHLRVDDKPLIVYYQPDAGSPTVLADMDEAVGLAYSHRRCLVIVHEWGELARVHQTPPMTRRALSQGRGRQVSLLLLMHRPANVDMMTFTQSDVVVCFEVPKKADRERIVDDISWQEPDGTNRLDDFTLALRQLPPYGYLQFDRRGPKPTHGEIDGRLLAYPPLSDEELASVVNPHST